MPPPQVDALRYLDFISMITHIDVYCPATTGCPIHKKAKPTEGTQ